MVAASSPNPPTSPAPGPQVVAVAASSGHGFSKQTRPLVRLVEGLGVEGDAHHGRTVQHLSRIRRAPDEPNLRQVHLIQAELFQEMLPAGHRVLPGQLGENVTTTGLDLLALPVGTVLLLGDTAEVRLTGLRNPCRQINDLSPGLLKVVVTRADGVASTSDVTLTPTGGAESLDGVGIIRKAGVMAVVERGGEVRPGMAIEVVPPEGPHQPLAPV